MRAIGDLVLLEGSYCVVEKDIMEFPDGIFRCVRDIKDNSLTYVKECNLQPCYINTIDKNNSLLQEFLYTILIIIISIFVSDIITVAHIELINPFN